MSDKVRELIKKRKGVATEVLIKELNPIIRGWANYHRHAVSKQTFSYVDSQIFNSIWQWCCRRHPNKGRRWVKDKYFASKDNRNWVFSATYKNTEGKWNTINLINAVHVPIRRHIKIRANATPYDSEYQTYFAERAKRKKISDYKESTYLKVIGNNSSKHTPSKPLGHLENGFIKA